MAAGLNLLSDKPGSQVNLAPKVSYVARKRDKILQEERRLIQMTKVEGSRKYKIYFFII